MIRIRSTDNIGPRILDSYVEIKRKIDYEEEWEMARNRSTD